MPQSSFEIRVRFLGGLSATQREVFELAAARWTELITADVPAVDTDIGLVAGLVIDAAGATIDGPGKILGRAGPTKVRYGTLIPARGVMEFDTADLEEMERNGSLVNVIIHEMGHVLGLGTLWSLKELIEGSNGPDPLYIGSAAMRVYGELVGSTAAEKVPLANTGGPGTREGHWRENVFGNELMTGYLNGGLNPLSRLTVAALHDLGYHVNYNAADPYTLASLLKLALLDHVTYHACHFEVPDVEVLGAPSLAELAAPDSAEMLTGEPIQVAEFVELEADSKAILSARGLESPSSETDPVIQWIDATPRLPAIPIRLTLRSGFSLVALSYRAHIEYRDHGRNDRTTTVSGSPNALAFDIDFGPAIQGGTLQVVFNLRIRRNSDGAVGSGTIEGHSSIRGRNPDRAAVKQQLGDISSQVTAYRESRFRQFDGSGRPLFGPPNGFGVMQLDNPPATARQIWDWLQNVDVGKALFEQKRRDANGYAARVRKQHPEATDLSPAQLVLETYQRYNGGAYWKWDPQRGDWVARPPNNYANESLALQRRVEQGDAPSDWS